MNNKSQLVNRIKIYFLTYVVISIIGQGPFNAQIGEKIRDGNHQRWLEFSSVLRLTFPNRGQDYENTILCRELKNNPHYLKTENQVKQALKGSYNKVFLIMVRRYFKLSASYFLVLSSLSTSDTIF